MVDDIRQEDVLCGVNAINRIIRISVINNLICVVLGVGFLFLVESFIFEGRGWVYI